MMESFVAIDFETAQGYRWSICQVGLVRVEEEIITNKINLLVKPPGNYYWNRFTDIHGINSEKTTNAPTFNQIWHQIKPFINNQNVVAHNGFGFDFPCLKQTLEFYGITPPQFTGHCTYRIFRDNQASLCRKYDIPHALSDAEACAGLFLMYLKNKF